MQSIHGRAAHVGRHPADRLTASDTVDAKEEKKEEKEEKKKLSALKREMDQAVRDQNFEEAARLRDEIRELENGKEGR